MSWKVTPDYIKNWKELSNGARERRIKACDGMPASVMGKHELIIERFHSFMIRLINIAVNYPHNLFF